MLDLMISFFLPSGLGVGSRKEVLFSLKHGNGDGEIIEIPPRQAEHSIA